MNWFGVNEAEVNGDLEVRASNGTAKVALSFVGLVSAGKTLKANASVAMKSSLTPTIHRYASGKPKVAVNAAGFLLRRAQVEAIAEVEFDVSGTYLIIQPPKATFPIIIESQIESRVATVAPVISDATITTSSSLTPKVIRYGVGSNTKVVLSSDGELLRLAKITGGSLIKVESDLDAYVRSKITGNAEVEARANGDVTRRAVVIGRASIEFRVKGNAKLRGFIKATGSAQIRVQGFSFLNQKLQLSSSAEVTLSSRLNARLGRKIKLGAKPATIRLNSRLKLGTQHYIRLTGSAQLSVTAKANQYGVPTPPNHYLPAVPSRIFKLQSQSRAMYVTKRIR